MALPGQCHVEHCRSSRTSCSAGGGRRGPCTILAIGIASTCRRRRRVGRCAGPCSRCLAFLWSYPIAAPGHAKDLTTLCGAASRRRLPLRTGSAYQCRFTLFFAAVPYLLARRAPFS